MSLGSELAKRREELGLSRKDMSREIGIALPTLADIEEGKRQPQRGTVEKIRAYLDASESAPPPTPKARRKPAATPTEAPPEAELEESDEDAPGAGGLRGGGSMASSLLILEKIDTALESLRAARVELAPDDAVPMPVKCRDLASLAKRIAAIEVALMKHGIKLDA